MKGTASEATLVSLLAAKSKAIKKVKESEPQMEDHAIVGRLVAYSSGKSGPVKLWMKVTRGALLYRSIAFLSGKGGSAGRS